MNVKWKHFSHNLIDGSRFKVIGIGLEFPDMCMDADSPNHPQIYLHS